MPRSWEPFWHPLADVEPPPPKERPTMLAKLKAAYERSRTIAWLVWTGVGTAAAQLIPAALDVIAMPEVAQLIAAWLPGWSTLFAVAIGIIARLRTLDLK